MDCKKCLFFLKLLLLGVELAIFICVCIIVSISSKDPFKSHIIGNITDYFSYIPDITSSLKSMCICKNETFEHFCSKENDLNGCFNISSDIDDFKPLFKRKLESNSFCTDMRESLARNEGKKLSYIFDLNYQKVRKLSIALLVVCLSYLISFSIGVIFVALLDLGYIDVNGEKVKKESENKIKCYIICMIVFSFLSHVGWIAKFVLSLLLLHFIESGDIGKYDDFLDCRYVKKSYFKKFNDVNKLRKCFLVFAILNIIKESADKIKEKFEDCDKLQKIQQPTVVCSSSSTNIANNTS